MTSEPATDRLTQIIAEYVSNPERGPALDEAAIARAKIVITDLVGAALAGVDADGAVQFRKMQLDVGGVGEATVFGTTQRLPAHMAAASNSVMARALEIDDVHEQALMHVGATVVPAAIAALQASREPVSGMRLIDAVTVGADLGIRMALSAQPLGAWDGNAIRGMSTTYQVGVFAAALTAARLGRFSELQVRNTIGYAYSLAAGNQQATYDGALAIRIQQGLTTGSGMFAARLAHVGLQSATRPLEGEAGYYNLYWRGRYDPHHLLDGLGIDNKLSEISLKPYACCKCSHNAITAALELRDAVRLSEIHSVEIQVPSREYFFTVAHPVEARQDPSTLVEAQFSMPFTVAVALAHGIPDLALVAQCLSDPVVRTLSRKIRPVLVEPDHGTMPIPATVMITLRDGSRISRTATTSPGHPARPLSWNDVIEKLYRLATFPDLRLTESSLDSLVNKLPTLEACDDVDRKLLSQLTWEHREPQRK